MNYIKLYENYSTLDSLCKKYGINNYVINGDSVDVNGNVFLFKKFEKIPIKFGTIDGDFYCQGTNITSLENSPRDVCDFYISNSKRLKSLEVGPYIVRGSYICSESSLNNLKGIVDEVFSFYCANNMLVNLENSPRIKRQQNSDFNVSHNSLESLEGSPSFGGNFLCSHNKLKNLIGGPKEVNNFSASNNPLISLEGCPYVSGIISIENTPLYDLIIEFYRKYKLNTAIITLKKFIQEIFKSQEDYQIWKNGKFNEKRMEIFIEETFF